MVSLNRLAVVFSLLLPHAAGQVVHDTFIGAANEGQFGFAVGAGEDYDGDGFSDILVGAPYSDAGGTNVGMVRLLSSATGAVLQEHIGAVEGATLGYSVAFVGDLDLDGSGDFAIGAPRIGVGPLVFPGRVEVYSGSTALPILIIESPNSDYDRFGHVVAGPGDVNLDGVPDIAIAAINHDDNRGQVLVYSGATGSMLWSVQGTNIGDDFGRSMDAIGDVDGDGVSDILVSAPEERVTGSYWGRVYVLSGSNGAVISQVQGAYMASQFFGNQVRGLGDIDLDGTPDWAMGLGSFDPTESRSVQVRSGATGALLLDLESGVVGDQYGVSIGAAGDVDGNGQPDIAVGAPRDSTREDDSGAIWVHDGATGATIFKVEGENFRDRLGSSVVGVGDTSGDGLDDLATGATQFFAGPFEPGFVVLLGWDRDGTVIDFELQDDFSTVLVNGQIVAPDAAFGELLSIRGVGLGQYGAAIFDSDPLGPNAGGPAESLLVDQGNVLILQETEAQTGGVFQTPEHAEDGGTLQVDFVRGSRLLSLDLIDLGTSVPASDSALSLTDAAGLHRVYSVPSGWTNDGTQGASGIGTLDLSTLLPQQGFDSTATAVQDPGFDPDAVVRLRIHFGGEGAIDNLAFATGPTPVPTGLNSIAKVSGPEQQGYGRAMANAGDVNGDGVADLIVGAGLGGKAWVYSGADGSILFFQAIGSLFGTAVDGVGDLDGDSFADIAVGAPAHDFSGDNAGLVWVYSGQTGQLMYLISGMGEGERLGSSVCGIGDANGDGVGDIAIGAPFDDRLGLRTGRLDLYSGVDGSLLWSLYGASAESSLGSKLAAVGDLDGDGHNDVLVSAPGFSPAQVVPVVLVVSGATGLAIREVLGGSSTFDFGDALAGIDDLDGDGVPDFLIGVPKDPTVGPSAGAVFALSGATGGLIHALFAQNSGDNFGGSVASAGDTNGDGLPDILVGAKFAEGIGTGTARLFSGKTGELLQEFSYNAPPFPFTTTSEQFGTSVAGLGDVNGDGFSEFAVSSLLDVVLGEEAASVWILPGAGPIGFPLCLGQSNSTGERATLEAYGSTVAEANNLTLNAGGLPDNTAVLVFHSAGFGLLPFPQAAGVPSDGILCLAGAPIGRYLPGAAILGQYSLTLDLESLPLSTGHIAVQVGETRIWQAWYRDSGSPGRSNFSDALAVTFQ